MSEPKRIEYEGPVSCDFWIEEWGTVYLRDELLADKIMEMLGVPKGDYEYEGTEVANVRIVVEVLDGTLVKESDLRKERLALGLRQSEPIPPPIDFDPPSAPEAPPVPEAPPTPETP